MAGLGAAILSGLLLWASFPPIGFGVLAFIAPVPLLWAIRHCESAFTALMYGWVTGAVYFGLLLFWISELGMVAWLPLTLYQATTMGVLSLVLWLFKLWPERRWWFITIGLWVGLEILRSYFPFGGFPWGAIGYATAGLPGAIGSVQWIGPAGWSALTIGVAAGIVLLIEEKSQWQYVVDSSVAVIILITAGSFFGPSPQGPLINVAIIQGGSPCPQVHCQNENQRIYDSHLALTRGLPDLSVELVVWPENSSGPPVSPLDNDTARDEITAEAARLGAYLLVSGTLTLSPEEFRNFNVMYAPGGNLVGIYDKRHPVPFGEFVPMRELLSFIPQLDQVPRDMKRGSDPVVFQTLFGGIGSVISFEGAFSRYMREEALEGAQLMIVATNESSFGPGPASDQLLGLTRVNAAAVGQDLVHAAITGKSAFVQADGTVIGETDLLTEEVLVGAVRLRTGPRTLFTSLGEWFGVLSMLAAVVAFLIPGKDRPQRRSSVARSSR
ncbi:MAG: apolipoprotein N-acyltransferase [Acidobacteria bacterium]|nr:apolipoprotein N-acyltransferase [Acidobacteriota bacterium]